MLVRKRMKKMMERVRNCIAYSTTCIYYLNCIVSLQESVQWHLINLSQRCRWRRWRGRRGWGRNREEGSWGWWWWWSEVFFFFLKICFHPTWRMCSVCLILCDPVFRMMLRLRSRRQTIKRGRPAEPPPNPPLLNSSSGGRQKCGHHQVEFSICVHT